jgi:hypothetical protein
MEEEPTSTVSIRGALTVEALATQDSLTPTIEREREMKKNLDEGDTPESASTLATQDELP